MNCNIIYINLLIIFCISLVNSQRKPGSCPSQNDLSVCGFTCRKDDDCSGESKCCRTSCLGSVCVRPILPKEDLEKDDEKPGSCPKNPGGRWVCSNRCGRDSDCGGKLKCCKGRCGGLACLRPE